jgi:hypothetical protein
VSGPNLPVGPDESTRAAYEELRRHSLLGAPGSQFGLVVLLREGVAAWIERRAASAGPGARPAADTPAMSCSAGSLQAEIMQLLVSMVLNQGKERQS